MINIAIYLPLSQLINLLCFVSLLYWASMLIEMRHRLLFSRFILLCWKLIYQPMLTVAENIWARGYFQSVINSLRSMSYAWDLHIHSGTSLLPWISAKVMRCTYILPLLFSLLTLWSPFYYEDIPEKYNLIFNKMVFLVLFTGFELFWGLCFSETVNYLNKVSGCGFDEWGKSSW